MHRRVYRQTGACDNDGRRNTEREFWQQLLVAINELLFFFLSSLAYNYIFKVTVLTISQFDLIATLPETFTM